MSERALLRMIERMARAARGAGVVRGIGDDCAILRAPGDWLLTTDLVLEDVHFRRGTHPPAAVGHRVLARGLSDIAAMGGTPLYCLVSLALPPWADARWVKAFYRGFLRLAQRTAVTLVGGDLARAERVACDIVVAGTAPRGKALRRDGARPGDAIYVSGELGGSALGLETGAGAAWRRHLNPEPRLELGRMLRARLGAAAGMDISDGLSIDLHRLCLASGVAASLDRPLPVFHGAALDHVLHGGEDYELLFTVRPGTRVPALHRGVPLTRIGTITGGRPGRVTLFGRPLAPLGWDHFRKR